MANDLFRMVSLRHSKPSQRDGAPPPDPRLRYQPLLREQANIAASPRETTLQQLKKRHAELSKKMAQLETVQRAVINTYMATLLEQPHPNPTPATHAPEAPSTVSRSVAVTGAGFPVIGDGGTFTNAVEKRLNTADTALFQQVIGSVPGETLVDIADVVRLFDIGVIIVDANSVCMQIQAIEQNLGEGLPTVPIQPSTEPVVSAVGWGDLIVARETLVGYEAREIAHIENILPGEGKLREHERLSKSEQVQETETITEKTTEKDSQTTDRYELQAQSQEAINQNFSISAGVNTSGQYGLTQVDTSLDAAFSQSESQSRSSTIDTAREIVNKAVQRTFERVRLLRRLTITEQIRELNRHELTNTGGTATPTAISGIYLWVEKIQKVELRHYGTRMMVEFHVPEPALSLYERAAVRNVRKKLPPFDVSPAGIQPSNYMCLAQRYGALDVEPPPTLFTEVGWGWTSTVTDNAGASSGDQLNSTINIPAGYRPISAKVAWSGYRNPSAALPPGELRPFNLAFSVGGKSQGIEHTVETYDGVVLKLDDNSDWPQGVPVSGRIPPAWHGAVYVQVTLSCVRTAEALDAWRLRTWQALRAGYEALERKAAQEEQQQAYQRNLLGPVIADGPAAENRRIERGELQKWAIKSMRLVPQNFNAIEQVDEFQEISPVYADAEAPIVRFYEDAFEWEHMNYFLYPYHWARRASWRMRTAAEAVDPLYQAFLQAGAARVIVPVTPGFEDKVAWFLDPSNAAVSELERILTPPTTSPPSSSSDAFRDLWIELLTNLKPDVARGSGTLKVESGNVKVEINPDSQWRISAQRDLGRELYIAGNHYEVASVTNETTFHLDRPYQGASNSSTAYVAGSTPFGPPWTVNVPTSLIVLAENVTALKAL
jgi:hypothetical protein